MRRSLLLTIVVLVTGAQSAMAADALPEVSNTDRYILRNLFSGRAWDVQNGQPDAALPAAGQGQFGKHGGLRKNVWTSTWA